MRLWHRKEWIYMFSQSLTAMLLKGIAGKISESMFFGLICKFLKAAGKFIEKLYGLFQKSILFGIFMTLTGALKKLYNGSGLKCYVDAKNFFDKPWSESGLARIADVIIRGLTYLAEKIGDFIKKLFCGSFILSVYDTAMEKLGFHRILAIVFGAMFLVYSSIWNNLYAAGICVILLFLLLYKNRKTALAPSNIDFFMVLFLISLVLGVISAPSKGDAVRIALIAASALGFHLCTAVILDDNKKIVDFIKIMSWVMAFTNIPAIVSAGLLAISSNKYVIFLLINVILLVVGTFMDMTPACLIFTPIFLPVCTALGMNTIHFGIMMIFNLCIGTITPPVGTTLFVGVKVGKVQIETVFRQLLVYFAAIFVVLMLVTYIPNLSLWLPKLMGYI